MVGVGWDLKPDDCGQEGGLLDSAFEIWKPLTSTFIFRSGGFPLQGFELEGL